MHQQPTSPNEPHRLKKRSDKGFFVVCATVDEILNVMDPDPNHYHVFAHRRWEFQYRVDFRDRTLPGRDYLAARWHERCTNCVCDDDGVVVAQPVRPLILQGALHCEDDMLARACASWYDCRCIARKDEEEQPPVGVEDAMAERVRDVLRVGYMGGRSDRAGDWIQEKEYLPWGDREDGRWRGNYKGKQLVGENPEPYFVEGPGGGTSLDWLGGSLLKGVGSGSLGFSIGKRDTARCELSDDISSSQELCPPALQ
ncbi:hypothetical protein TWF696_000417 [Orbilia brochopaga]|uniref:Uncharacterized protein n=1 Tax=Orbilia brochopaga TaxID=3140254 RepID=A0AAV9VDK4_9PEZI